jgi:peptidoglycan/LPS O-acetylase OafA/YrhL
MTIGRTPDGRSRNIELDFVRGLAILLVIGYHALNPVASNGFYRAIEVVLKTIGWTGVDLFFVLSGFLVGGVLLSEYRKTGTLDAKRFIIRRGLKIWPPYYFYLLFQLIVHKHPIKSYLLANLLHIQNYVGSSLEHTWTLSLEEHFYLLLSVALGWMVFRKWPPRRIIVAFLIAASVVMALRCLTWFLGFRELAEHATHSRIDSLLLGVTLTALLQFFPQHFERIVRHKFWLLSSAISSLGFLALVHEREAGITITLGYTIIYLGYGSLILLVYRHSKVFSQHFAFRVIARVGVYSYGIYLWHVSVREPCLHFANHFSPAARWPVSMVLQYATAIVLGTVLTHLVEWPFLRLRERFFPAKDRLPSLLATEQTLEGGTVSSEASLRPQTKINEAVA